MLLDALWDSPVALGLIDRDLRFLCVNESLARLHGVPADAHVGRRLGEILRDAPCAPHVARIEERIRDVVATGRSASLDVTLPRADGTAEWRCGYHPALAPPGAVRAICAMVVDVTAERERSAALERARRDSDRNAARVALLQGVTAALSAARDVPAVAKVVVERVGLALGASAATVRRLDRAARLVCVAAGGRLGDDVDPGAAIPLDADDPVAAAARRNEAVWIGWPELMDARYPALAVRSRAAGRAAGVAVPLAAGGRVLGSLALLFDSPRAFDLEERALVLALAEQSAQALDRALLREEEQRLMREATRARDRFGRLQALTAALSRARSASDVLGAIVGEAESTVGAHAAMAFVLPPGGDALLLAAAAGEGRFEERLRRLALDAPYPAATAARTGRTVWLETQEAIRAAFPRFAAELPGAERIRAIAALPLRVRGAVVGAVGLGFLHDRRFLPEERDALESAAEQCALAFDRAHLYDSERRLREEAERSGALLDAIFENAPIGIGVFDRDLRFVRVNARLAEMNGAPVEAHTGKTIREIIPRIPPEGVEAGLREVIDTGRPKLDVELSGETPAAPGEAHHWLESWYPVRAGGEVLGAGVLVRDVTAEREAQEFQRNVLGIVGHDLRNPLAAVAASAQLLRRPGMGADAARLADRILSNATRMERIIAVLVDYARVRGGQRIPIRRRACDLAAICRSVADECEASHPGRQVATSGEGDATGQWDPDRIGQVIANLVTNALDHSPPATAVDVRWRSSEAEVALEVANDGAPIPADVVPRLFDPFQRGERDGRDGLGLGLFIARSIATAHGGRIEVRSAPGERTVFTVRLPRC